MERRINKTRPARDSCTVYFYTISKGVHDDTENVRWHNAIYVSSKATAEKATM